MKLIDYTYLDKLNINEEELLHKLGYKPNYPYLASYVHTLYCDYRLSPREKHKAAIWNLARLFTILVDSGGTKL